MKYFFLLFFLLTICVAGIIACSEPDKPAAQKPVADLGSNVLIINEGNFTRGNASLSWLKAGQLTEDVFVTVNKRPLGDVAQSGLILNKNILITVNNSGKIELLNADDFTSAGTITGLRSPRYILPVSDEKAYVSDLYADALSIINLKTKQKTGSIPCKGWTEKMLLSDGKVYVTNRQKKFLYLINPQTDRITDSIPCPLNANSLVKDRQGNIWITCGGENGTGYILAFDNQNRELKRIPVKSSNPEQPGELTLSPDGNRLLFLSPAGAEELKISENQSKILVPAGKRLFYSLGVDPLTGVIYVGNAIDYVQKSLIHRFKSDGTPVDSFRVGIIAGEFLFIPPK